MLMALSTPRKRLETLALLIVCCALAASALAVGISDNPPGILLAYGAATALIVAVVHPWRTARRFWRLLYMSLLAFVLFAVLHNVCGGMADEVAGVPVLRMALQSIAVVTFLLAVMICPPAILVGATGSIAMIFRKRHRRTHGLDARRSGSEHQSRKPDSSGDSKHE